jgi:hypothetical protein
MLAIIRVFFIKYIIGFYLLSNVRGNNLISNNLTDNFISAVEYELKAILLSILKFEKVGEVFERKELFLKKFTIL